MKFSDVTKSLGLDALVSAYGLSLGDWNNDHCLDLFVGSHGRPSHLFENSCQGRFIDRIEQFGTEVTYRLHTEGDLHRERVFLAPSLAVPTEFQLNHETFLFHPPPRAEGARPAYYIWRDLKTMAWHIRWTGEGGPFTGTVSWGVPAQVGAYRFDDVDGIRIAIRSLDFSSTVLPGEEKGIDIQLSPFLRDDTTITFDLQVNGRYAREDIYIGSIGAHPWNDRFSLGAFSSLWVKPHYQSGSDIGYFLWRTPEDGVWHLRWSNTGRTRLFQGTVQAQKGTFSIIDNSSSKSHVLIEEKKNALRFRSKIEAGEAGFDFTIDSWKRQGLIEIYVSIDDQPATVHTGPWFQSNSSEASFSYGQSFSMQPFLFPSSPPTGFFVTPQFVGWRGVSGIARPYRGEIQASRTVSSAAFEPAIADSMLTLTSDRLSFTANSSESPQLLRFEHEGLRVFGDRHAAVWGDLDNDGDVDLYLSNGGGKGKGNILGGELWDNMEGRDFIGKGKQKGVNDPDGRGRGVSLVDYNNDGHLDIYKVNTERPCRLFHNQQGSFEDRAQQLGVAGPFGAYNAVSASWADFDQDDYMDLLLTSNPVRLFKNMNGQFFEDITAEAGLTNQHMVHAASWGDYDSDGDLDLYLAKAYGISQFRSSANVLLRNNGNGTFIDHTTESGVGSRKNSRDTTWLDYDNDGDLDLYVVNSTSLLSFVPWFFHPVLDMWLTLLGWNAFDHTNILYENRGDGTFRDVTRHTGVGGRGSNSGVAVGDFNRDGFVDLFLSSGYYPLETGTILAYQNQTSDNHWIDLDLIGRQSNRSAIGAKVYLYAESHLQFRELSGGVHGFSQDGPIVHFGLGKNTVVDRLEVVWPSRKKTSLENLTVDQLLTIRE